jgi:hypothetical protein
LGPVARKLISPDKWTDGYPGPDTYIKELDVLLKFADEKGCLKRFVPNLEARDKQRNKTLSELRLAYLLEEMEFSITSTARSANSFWSRLRRFRYSPRSRVPVGRASYRRNRSQLAVLISRNTSNSKAAPSATGEPSTAAYRRQRPTRSIPTISPICSSSVMT